MLLSSLSLQNFRNYTQANFLFSSQTTVIVGPNTAGKTNLLDSIHLLSTGKSFLTDQEEELIRFGEEFARIKGTAEETKENRILDESLTIDSRKLKAEVEDRGLRIEDPLSTIYYQPRSSIIHHLPSSESIALEVLITAESERHRAGRRYFVNGVTKRRIDFATHLPVLLFTPMHLSIISGSPSQRRNFLDELLEQVDKEYARSLYTYMKALRQRNALLEHTRETGYRNEQQFQYWDELLIMSGSYIHSKRQEVIDFMNAQTHTIFPFHAVYDHSVISEERLEKYRQAEMGAYVTLVGPHRDEVGIQMTEMIDNRKLKVDVEARGLKIEDPSSILHYQPRSSMIHNPSSRSVKTFASRGQQRLVVLQLKLLQLDYMKKHLETEPILLLDDIFSELDSSHIQLVSDMIGKQQTIITTTHEEFIQGKFKKMAKVIELVGK